MQEGEFFRIAEDFAFGQQRRQETDGAIGFERKRLKVLAPGSGRGAFLAGQEQRLALGRSVGRRQIDKGQKLGTFEQRARAFELRAAFLIDEARDRVPPFAKGILR